MMRSTAITIGLCASLAVFIFAIGARRLASAHAQVDAAEASLAGLRRDAAAVVNLRKQRQRIAERKRPDGDVNGHVLSVLSSARLPGTHLKSVRTDSDTALPERNGGVKHRRQTVRVELAGLTLAGFGRFLEAWRRDQPLWSVSRLSLVHDARSGGGRSRSASADQTYLFTITVNAIYVDDSRGT